VEPASYETASQKASTCGHQASYRSPVLCAKSSVTALPLCARGSVSPACAWRGLVFGEEHVEFVVDVIRVWPARVAGRKGHSFLNIFF
jgi:hypothetical protein